MNQNHKDFEEYQTMPIDFGTFVSQKMAVKSTIDNKSFDPHKLMVNKLKLEKGEEVDTQNIVKWPEEELKALDDFCKKHGIIGFNCGRMSPVAALAMLKQKIGVGDVPLEERVPYGYQRVGNKKSSILHG